MQENLTVILPAVIIAAGLFAGQFIGFAAHEEMRAGKKWLALLASILFSIAAFVFLFSFKNDLWVVVVGATTLFAVLAFKEFQRPEFTYALLGVAYALLAGKPLFLLFASTAFLYGIPSGSLHKPYVASIAFLPAAVGLQYL